MGGDRVTIADASAGGVPEELRELARQIASLLGVVHRLAEDTDEEPSPLAARVGEHLGVDPLGLAVVSEEIPPYQLIDVQVALEVWAARPGRGAEVIGVAGERRRFQPLSELMRGGRRASVGPVDYQDLADSPTTTRRCVRFGLFLLTDGERRLAALLRSADPHGPMRSAMLEVLSDDEPAGRALLADLRALAVEHSVLRRQVLALGPGEGQQYGLLRFVPRPVLGRDQLVLPDETLGSVERHVTGMARHGDRLRSAGQHLKRGVLLYGPPGTGKTHTVRYLLAQRPEATAFVLSGQALGQIAQACALARSFQPSMVVLEDIDLIGGDRSFGPVGSNPLLFEVLNQIDGLGDDVDVTFVLTTNRVDILERALAERPGRVDAAVEIRAPDAEGRRRLLRLYGAGAGVDRLGDDELQPAVEVTEAATATYLREVVRRAALLVAERAPGAITVDGATLAEAASELVHSAGVLARAMAGASPGAGGGEGRIAPPVERATVVGHGYTVVPGRPRLLGAGDREGGPPPFVPDP